MAIGEFLEDVARAGSARSAETYRTALARSAECLDERLRRARRLPRRKPDEPLLQPAIHELSVEDAIEFARWLETYMARSRGRAPSQSMLFTYTSALQSFFAFLHRERLRRDLDLEELRERLRRLRGRREKRLPRVPADSVVDALCRAAQALPRSTHAQVE